MGHHHHHNHGNNSDKNLRAAFFLNLGFTILEIFGGLYVNSVAIISDAVHDLGDSLSLGLAWYLNKKSQKEANSKFSFGYSRFSLLGALINSLVLIIGSVFVINEAVKRLITPETSEANGMIVFAIIGVVVNGYAAWKLSSGKSLNERVVSWHLLEDVLGWVAVLIVAITLKFYNSPYLDPALSLLITAYILWNVIKRLRETIYLFLQGVPQELDLEKIREQILQVENVTSQHHTHIWSLDGEKNVITTHLVVKQSATLQDIVEVKRKVKEILFQHPIEHATIEVEFQDEDCYMDEETTF